MYILAVVSGQLHPHTLTSRGYLSNEAVTNDFNVPLPSSIIELQIEATKQAGSHNIELGESETYDKTVSFFHTHTRRSRSAKYKTYDQLTSVQRTSGCHGQKGDRLD